MKTYSEPQERDIAAYAVIGHELLHGRLLYSDLWDHKPPAIHMSFALAESVLGYGALSIFGLNFFTSLLTMIGLLTWVRRFSPIMGVWAAFSWVCLSIDLTLQANQPNTEVFINAFLVCGFSLLTIEKSISMWRLCLAGCSLAMATMYKQIAIFPICAFLIILMCKPGPFSILNRIRVGLTIFGLISLVWGGTAGYFWIHGRFQDFYEAVFLYNRWYGRLEGGLFKILQDLWAIGSLTFHQFPALTYGLTSFLLITGILACQSKNRSTWALLLAYSVGSFIAIVFMRYRWPHYFVLLLPPLILSVAFFFSYFPRVQWIAWALLLSVFLFHSPHLAYSPREWSEHKYGKEALRSYDVAPEIQSLLDPGETFYNWGSDPGLYLATTLSPPVGVFYNYPLLRGPLTEKLIERTIRDLKTNNPTLVVVSPQESMESPMGQWIQSKYERIPNFGSFGFTYWKTRSNPSEDRSLRVFPKSFD